MSLSPAFRTPFTDLTGHLANHQYYSPCGKMEMKMMNCLEAYGLHKGKQVCADMIEDFNECVLKKKQLKRLEIMLNERQRQYEAGERSKEEYFAPAPRVDAY